jgi:hypothetical protein
MQLDPGPQDLSEHSSPCPSIVLAETGGGVGALRGEVYAASSCREEGIRAGIEI